MLTPDDAQYLTEAVAALGVPLYESLEKGRSAAHDHYDAHHMKDSNYRKGRTDLTRDHARRLLSDADLGGWQLANGSSSRIHLSNNALKLKVLHGTPFEGTPAPGRNQARISYYRNPEADLLGVQASNLIAVWTDDPKTGEVSVRIVRPVREWKYGRAPVVDLDFVLLRSVDDFGEWQFVPDDEGLTLPFELDEDLRRDEGGRSGA